MPEPAALPSAAVGGPWNRRSTALVAIVVVGFIGVALAKPWGSPARPLASTQRPSDGAVADLPRISPTGSVLATLRPLVTAPPAAFVTPLPPPATAVWTGLRWRLLAPDDPLTLVRSVVTWPGGFVAAGGDALGTAPTTPLWTSADGARWAALPFGTAPTIWPEVFVRGVAGTPVGLVALTERLTGDCGGAPCPAAYAPLVMAWSSLDGRAWAATPFPALGPAGAAAAPLVASGPAGLVAISTGASAGEATSDDGATWTRQPPSTIPADFAVVALKATRTGYVLVGTVGSSGGGSLEAATLWSPDGRAWSGPLALPTAALPGGGVADRPAIVDDLVAGRDGLVALGRSVATPSADIWWQAADGQTWQAQAGYPPLGPTTCVGNGCGGEADGVLAGDGQRMVALSYRPDAEAWTSSDGSAWQRLEITGDLPSEQARRAIVLPGGVLFTDGFTTWFGEALVQ